MGTQLFPTERNIAPPLSRLTDRGPCLLWPNGSMDQDVTWHGGMPRPRRHCVRWGPISPTVRVRVRVTAIINIWYFCNRHANFVITTTGFHNWKTALEDGRGFAKHASSKIDVDAALKWAERNVRIDRNLTIQSQLSSSQIEKNGITLKVLSKSCSFLLLMS